MKNKKCFAYMAIAVCFCMAGCETTESVRIGVNQKETVQTTVQETKEESIETISETETPAVSETVHKETEENREAESITVSEGAFVFTDDLGRDVTLSSVERVAVLNASYADIWSLAGGVENIVAASSNTWTDVEIDLKEDVIDLGATNHINLEQLIACEPDFVIASSDISQNMEDLESYEAAGLPVAYFSVTTFSDYLRMLELCTDLTGNKEAYAMYGEALQQQVDEVFARVPEEKPNVLYVRTTASGVKVKNSKGSILGQMLSDLGCENIADSETSLLEDVSMEVIIKENPDFIFAIYMGSDTAAIEANMNTVLFSNPAWETLDAVKEGHFHIMENELYNLKPNARWGEAYEKLADILYPQS